MRRGLGIAVLCIVGGVAGIAQQPSSPAFEVASVKENTTTDSGMFYRWEPGGLRVGNMPVHGLLVFAYGVTNPEGLINVPGWVRTVRFDINASLSNANARPDIERRVALQNLLADRFKLVLRPTSQDVDAFLLTKVNADLGPSMRVADLKCDSASIAARGGDSTACRFSADRAKGFLQGRMTANDLVAVLKIIVAKPVIDRTGLTDEYDVTLRWAPEAGGVTLEPTDGASIFTALREQLGLHLVAGKAPANAYIIEHIERPTQN